MSKKKRPRETKSKDENEGKRERDEEKDEGTAGGILKGLGNIIPGLGGLVKSLEKSPAFKERLKQVDKELEHKIRSAPLKRRGGATQMSGRFGRRSLRRGSSSGPVKKEAPPPKPQERPADIFDEKDYVKVIAEIPGVEEKDIGITLQDDMFIIDVDIFDRKYHQELKLPCVPKGKMEKTYRNGILEVKLLKADS